MDKLSRARPQLQLSVQDAGHVNTHARAWNAAWSRLVRGRPINQPTSQTDLIDWLEACERVREGVQTVAWEKKKKKNLDPAARLPIPRRPNVYRAIALFLSFAGFSCFFLGFSGDYRSFFLFFLLLCAGLLSHLCAFCTGPYCAAVLEPSRTRVDGLRDG